MNSTEIWELYDSHGQNTGVLFERNADAPKLPPGHYHLVVVAWIFFRGNFLLQRRSRQKVYGAGKWSVPGGSVLHGETRKEALKREIYEETGLTVDVANLTFLCREQNEDYFCDAYLYMLEEKPKSHIIEPNEVDQLKWFSIKEVNSLMNSDYIAKHSLSYEKALCAIPSLNGGAR